MTVERHCRPQGAPSQPVEVQAAQAPPVQVLYGKRRFRSARVRNLSAQGMSLTLRNLTLPAGTLVELELDGPGPDRRPVAAVVVRSLGSEATVAFREPQIALARDLAQADAGPCAEGQAAASEPPSSRSPRPQLARR